MPETYTAWGVEPRIEDVMADPIVHALMRSDGLSPDQVRAAIEQASAALFGRRRRQARPGADYRAPLPIASSVRRMRACCSGA